MRLKPHPAGRPKPSPMPCQQRTAKQIDIDGKRIETPFIFFRPDAHEGDCAGAAFHGGMIWQYCCLPNCVAGRIYTRGRLGAGESFWNPGDSKTA